MVAFITSLRVGRILTWRYTCSQAVGIRILEGRDTDLGKLIISETLEGDKYKRQEEMPVLRE